MFTHLKSAAEKMLIDFEATRDVPHNLTKGMAREAIVVSEFLKPYLPTRYSVSSGLVTDLQGNSSKQQDIVIYDQFQTPILRNLGSDMIFFPESVYAAIEVKSTLNRRELRDVVEKSVSLWALQRTGFPSAVLTPGVAIPSTSVPAMFLGMCFTSRMTLDEMLIGLQEQRKEFVDLYSLSGICTLRDKDNQPGLIVSVRPDNLTQVSTTPRADNRLAVIRCETPGHALLYFYLMLMEHLRSCGIFMPGPDLRARCTAVASALPDGGL